jgi:parallel beta-helix repeat protein
MGAIAAAATPAALDATFVKTVSLEGAGIDPTGAADSTVAIQAKLDGAANAQVYLPAGTYKVSATVTVSAERTHLSGPGVLSWVAGIENSPALRITGSASSIDGIKLINPLEIGANAGTASSGLSIQANDVIVRGCLLDSFQSGIHVLQNGEWMNIIITNNRIKDVLGSGDGVLNATSDKGEDRGDGIMVMGAGVTIIGNVVNAKEGRDARIGIHCEALTDQAMTHPAGENRSFTISGNVVTGPFRRSIATEDVSNATISGNTCADATWWGISVSGTCTGVTVTGNTLAWTKRASDTPGRAWGPRICCFQVLNGVKGTIFSGNIVTLTGVAEAAFLIDGGLGFPDNVTIADNVFQCSGGSFGVGISATETGIGNVKVRGNIVEGFTEAGASIGGVSSFSLVDNYINGVTLGAGDHWGVLAGGSAKGGVISSNRIANVRKGIERGNTPGASIISGNEFASCTTGIDLYGSSSCIAVNNTFVACTTAVAEANDSNITSGNISIS